MRRSYWYLLIMISGIIFTGLLLLIVNSNEGTKNMGFVVSEGALYDPLCAGKQIFTIDYSTSCIPTSQWSYSLGSSTNIDDTSSASYWKILYMKVLISKIPSSDLFKTITVTDAELVLRTTTDSSNKLNIDNEFAVYNGLCEKSDWSNNTSPDNLPCIRKDKNFDAVLADFSEYKKASALATTNIDIKNHVNYGIDHNLNAISELIEFVPKSSQGVQPFNEEQRSCLYNQVKVVQDMNACVGSNRIAVYGIGHPTDGLKPHVVIEYNEVPTILGTMSNGIVQFMPALISVIVVVVLNKKNPTNVEDADNEGNDDGEDDEESPDNQELIDESKVIGGHEFEPYGFDFDIGDEITGKITSNMPVNVYIMDNKNLERFEEEEEFDPELESEQVTRYSLNFTVPKTRAWHIVIENPNSKSANVDVKLSINAI